MERLHIFFLPMLAHGHFNPMVSMAKLFASRGIKTTIISTAPFSQTIKTPLSSKYNFNNIIIDFPPKGSDLPDHVQNLEQGGVFLPKFLKALDLLQEPVEKMMEQYRPTCLVSDMFFTWTTDSAAKFGIPRLSFNGSCIFAECAAEEMIKHEPFKNLSPDDDESLVQLPNLPHRIMVRRQQVSPELLVIDEFSNFMKRVRDSFKKSYGMVFNSFYELEPDYAHHYRTVLDRKAWHIGPFLLKETEEELKKGRELCVVDVHECLPWLDSKRPDSVLYICFGTLASFTPDQLRELAIGLEASGVDFIWVLGKSSTNKDMNEDWLPKGFEKKIQSRGVIIRGWAPQVVILDHPATGTFLTHCGWNSILEGVCAGVSMITWPLFAEQLFNEKLVTEVLRTGISVGNKKWQFPPCEGVLSDAVSAAVQQAMTGEAVSELRSRARNYRSKARLAIGEDGGSSYIALTGLIEELIAYNDQEDRKQRSQA